MPFLVVIPEEPALSEVEWGSALPLPLLLPLSYGISAGLQSVCENSHQLMNSYDFERFFVAV
jgi:hypothetical protein